MTNPKPTNTSRSGDLVARLREIVALENDFESNAAMTAHEWLMLHTARAALAGDSHDQ